MFRAILVTQWKSTRAVIFLATIAGFAIPLASAQSARSGFGAIDIIGRMQTWGVAYALLAAGAGLLVALAAWRADQHGKHIYALTLPVTRPRYALMRLGAGAVYLLIPILAVLVASVLVSVTGVPVGLRAYPLALTLRFALATAVAYALFFSISAGTARTAAIILGAIASVFFLQYVFAVMEVRYNILAAIADFVFVRPGLLSVFSGRWTLIDA